MFYYDPEIDITIYQERIYSSEDACKCHSLAYIVKFPEATKETSSVMTCSRLRMYALQAVRTYLNELPCNLSLQTHE